jgi:hypothetical protein
VRSCGRGLGRERIAAGAGCGPPAERDLRASPVPSRARWVGRVPAAAENAASPGHPDRDSGADVFTFTAGQGLVTDPDAAEGAITLINFGADCDLLAELSTDPAGTSVDLSAGECVLIPGRTAAEFSADEFLLA